MNRYMWRFLNDAALRKMPGERYEGIIDTVTEELLRDRFAGTKRLEPVILFDDGWRLVPNVTMRRALIEWWGPQTDEWTGRRVIVFRHRVEQTKNAVDAEAKSQMVERFEKRIMRADVAVEFSRRRTAIAGGGQ